MAGKRHVCAAALVAMALCGPASGETLTAANGYRVDYDIYPATGTVRPLTLVFTHGKNSFNRTPNMRRLAEGIAASGVRVILPVMPWSRKWDGTVQDGISAMDTLVAAAASGGDRVVIGGQSLGATFTMIYRPGDAPPAVAGRLLTSPGALIELIPPASPFWARLKPALDQARALERAGKGKEVTQLGGTNVTGTRTIEESYATTPEIYLSFHDPDRFPKIRAALAAIPQPVFWTVGTADPVPNARRNVFDMVKQNPASRYLELPGDHNSAMLDALPAMIDWLAQLPPR